jgi:hypothetical protein
MAAHATGTTRLQIDVIARKPHASGAREGTHAPLLSR